jgi:hypothetical protein
VNDAYSAYKPLELNGSIQIFATGGSERVRIDTSGNVGSGTSSPGHKLDVNTTGGSIATARLLGNDQANVRLRLENSGSGGRTWELVGGLPGTNNSSFSLRDVTGGTTPLTVDSNGNLLVGTISVGGNNERMNVVRTNVTISPTVVNLYNSAATSTGKNANFIFRVASQGSGADANAVFTDSVSHNYFFGGNNGGAYVVANSNGVRLSSGGTSWASDSDERVKDIIEPITNAAQKVSTLRSVIGKYKTDPDDKRRAFLIAQDVQAVLPEAVFDEQGTLMLAYTDVIPLLVAAIQEQQALIIQLQADVAALKGAA